MCGISGVVSQTEVIKGADHIIAAMNNAQMHRGPDGEGSWIGKGAIFGHRRLSIIDLSENGRQPMTNEDGSLVLICNGEIYNYKQLKRDLIGRGHIFNSNTDVEVILHLYEDYGDDCVQHLVGMFAFAVWDLRSRRLLLARDRIGEKPVYYAQTEGLFIFASEVKALLTVPGVARDLDDNAVAALLVYQGTPAPFTFFKGIKLLPPASILVWDKDRIQISRYWKIDFSANRRRWKWDDAIQRYDEILHESTQGCSIADVPVGVMLSGGIDSSAIAIQAAHETKDLMTFCVGYEGAGKPDAEFKRASEVARVLGTRHYNIHFKPLSISMLPKVVCHYDQPFNVFSMLYVFQLAEEIGKRVKVVLGGNGADELFGGYRGYNQHLLMARSFPVVKSAPLWAIAALPIDVRRKLIKLKQLAKLPLTQIRGAHLNAGGIYLSEMLFTPNYSRVFSDCLPGRLVDEYAVECHPRDYLDTVLYTDLMIYHQHGTTTISDVSGMAHGLEIRAPFLDHRLIEFAYTLPRRMTVPSSFQPNRNKLIMKRSLQSHLPRNIVYARKMGFGYNIDLGELISNAWKQVINEFVLKGRYLDLGVFSAQGVRWAIENSPAHVWMLLVFSIWAEIYLFGEKDETASVRIMELLQK